MDIGTNYNKLSGLVPPDQMILKGCDLSGKNSFPKHDFFWGRTFDGRCCRPKCGNLSPTSSTEMVLEINRKLLEFRAKTSVERHPQAHTEIVEHQHFQTATLQSIFALTCRNPC